MLSTDVDIQIAHWTLKVLGIPLVIEGVKNRKCCPFMMVLNYTDEIKNSDMCYALKFCCKMVL